MNLVARAKGILVDPKAEWTRIAAEPASVQSIYTTWIMVLALIGPIMMLLNAAVYGATLGIGFGLRAALGFYVIALVTVALVALVADVLSPNFGGSKDFVSSLKLAAYSATPVALAEIALIFPGLGPPVMLLGAVYAFYLFFIGAPLLARTSSDKAVPYTLVVVLGTIVIIYLIRAIIFGVIYAPVGAGTLSLLH